MKALKIFIAVILISNSANAQKKLFGNGKNDINTFWYYWMNSADTLMKIKSDSIVFYKPINNIHTLDAKFTTAGNSGTGETDLYSYSVPANKLSTDGRTVNFEIDGEFNDNTATATVKLYFAGNVTLNTGAVNISTALTAWRIKGYIIRTSSTTAHVTYEMQCPGLATTVFVGYNNLTSLDFTVGNIFKVTAQAGGAGGGNDDITAHSWQLLYKPQPQ